MSNAITKGTAELSLEQCDELLITGVCNIRDAILGYTQYGLTQTQISERVKDIGFKASVPTIKRHVADLRKEGLLPAVETSQHPEAAKTRRRREKGSRDQNDLMTPPIQPTVIPTNDEPTRSPVSSPILSVVPDLEPLIEVSVVEDSTCLPMGITYEQQQGANDYNEFNRLQAYLCKLLERNAFTNRISPEQWNSIRGGLRPLVEIAEVQSRYTSIPTAN